MQSIKISFQSPKKVTLCGRLRTQITSLNNRPHPVTVLDHAHLITISEPANGGNNFIEKNTRQIYSFINGDLSRPLTGNHIGPFSLDHH